MEGIIVTVSRGEAGPHVPETQLEQLLVRIAQGEEAALEALYEATSPWVYGLALRILRDEGSAQEVTLDAYLHAWRRAADYSSSRGRPSTWLLTIARSRSIDRLRSQASRRRREEESGFDSALSAIEGPEPGREIDREAVRAAIAQLPPQQRRAIELAFFGGLSHSEIAREVGAPLGTIKSQVRLGMMKLRDLLEPPEHWGTA